MKKFNYLHRSAKRFSLLLIVGSMMISGIYAQNMSRYITLNCLSNANISMRLAADSPNTPVKIVSGDSTYTSTIDTAISSVLSFQSAANTMTIYGDVNVLDMYSTGSKNITNIDASHNAGLCTLWCNNSNLMNINLKGCTALRYLGCHNGKLTSLDVSNLTSLQEIICYTNEISSLNVRNCKALKKIDCSFNNLTTLDVSSCNSLAWLACDSNKFTTLGFDYLMCSLPDRSGNVKGYFRPLRDTNDGTYSAFMASNATNAKAKNWSVEYYKGGDIPATSGTYTCVTVDMSRYITLNVAKGEQIHIDLSADTNNTPIKIVSGTWDTTINVGSSLTGGINYLSNSDTIVIYGNVDTLDCCQNYSYIIGIDASHNTALKGLICSNNALKSLNVSGCSSLERLICYYNQLTSIDVSGCTSLKELDCGFNNLTSLDVSGCDSLNWLACENNQFIRRYFDYLMCSLPDRNEKTKGYFHPLRDVNDGNKSVFMASNASNAKSKNWSVEYYQGGNIFVTSGTYDCNGGTIPQVNMSRYIELNVTKNTLINIDLLADTANTPILIVSGTWDTIIVADVNKKVKINCPSYDYRMKVYGDVVVFDCSDNGNNLTDVSQNNDILKELYCKNNAIYNIYLNNGNLTTLDVSGCTSLVYLRCYNNNLTTLNVSGCTSLYGLGCSNNNLTSLNVSGCTSLGELSCYGNKFSTAGYDSLMCSFIDYSGMRINNYFSPLYDTNDANSAIFLAANASNATAKNWQVLYYDNGNTITTNGSYTCTFGGEKPEVDTTQYITLTGFKDAPIYVGCYANNRSLLKVKSGQWDTLVWHYDIGDLYFYDSIITIYGQFSELGIENQDIVAIDASHNTSLKYLSCYSNNLTSLNVSGCTSLEYLGCESNNLTTLDVSDCIALNALYCYNNNLTSLDVSGCTSLEYLGCETNNLTTLNVSGCTSLYELYCYGNKFSTAGYDSLMCSLADKNSGYSGYIYPLYDTLDSNATTFLAANASNATAKNWQVLYYYYYNGNTITTNGSYLCPFKGNANQYITLSVEKGTQISLEITPIADNTPVRIHSGSIAYDIEISDRHYDSYYTDDTIMTIYGDINTFECSYNDSNITAIDASHNTILEKLSCNYNNLTSLDVSGCTSLAHLSCYSNNLTTLDVTGCTSLAYLDCETNNLTTLDVSDCIALNTLYCYNNNLDTLDVSGCISLEYLSCSSNNLTSLDVRGCTSLAYLSCESNNLTTLDVSDCIALCTLYCYRNSLTSLDVSGCTSLEYLDCNGNKLDTLEVRGCTSLASLDCERNNLTTLNVSGCTRLGYLDCRNNNLTSLDVSGCTSLGELYCYGNKFSTAGYDSLICLLPDYSEFNVFGYFYPLYDSTDSNATTFLAANASNATAKNWQVLYYDNGNTITTNGSYTCTFGGEKPEVDTTQYITLIGSISQEEVIVQYSVNGPIKIISGQWDTVLLKADYLRLNFHDTTIMIYGAIENLYVSSSSSNSPLTAVDATHSVALCTLLCADNYNMTTLNVSGCKNLTTLLVVENPNLTSLNVNACTALKFLACDENYKLSSLNVSSLSSLERFSCSQTNVRSLDISQNTALKILVCYGNPFTTATYDSLMCSLPMRKDTDTALFYPLYNATDSNATIFLAANASNATAKNWQVLYYNNDNTITTNGTYTCSGGGTNPEDTTNTNIAEIQVSNVALYPNPAKTVLNIENATEDVQIFDITGRLLINVENKETNLLQINVSHLSKGMYFVKVGNYTIKFVKE